MHFNVVMLQFFRQMRNENRNFQDFEQLVEALLKEPPATPVNFSPLVEERETVGPSPEMLASLKQQFPCLYPVNPHMRNSEDRLLTFDDRWPKHKINATVPHIVEAGFYFLGTLQKGMIYL